ncbi:MAG: FecR domain-containing protein [Opitutaceae bacterium]|nr:FecR domain-containing protein [Opitutaceae bacterium]
MNHPELIAREAVDWILRSDRGLSPVEQDEFFQWLAVDPRHGDAFARERQTWRDLDLLAEWRPEHSAEPNPDLLARPTIRSNSRVHWLAPVVVAAAACLALVAYVALRAPGSVTDRAAIVATSYEHRVLEDGSIAELNRGAAIEVAFTATERRVRLLRGEAHFTVTKNPHRPFVVHAQGVEARAVGTAFQVSLRAAAVEVLVTEGRVQVGPGPGTTGADYRSEAGGVLPIVAAGERVVVPFTAVAAPRITAVSADEIALSLAWQPRLLEFSAAPLAQVVVEFNRRNTVQLVIDDPALEAIPIVASFRSDNVEGFVRLLEVTAGLHANRQGDTISLQKKKTR